MAQSGKGKLNYRCPSCFMRDLDIDMFYDKEKKEFYCIRCQYTGSEEDVLQKNELVRFRYKDAQKRFTKFDFAFADSEGIISKVVKGASASKYGLAVASLDEVYGSYNKDYIDAPFYTNHDMGRSAGYYNGENAEYQTKLAGAMNLLMSGSAFLYYGEELGMKGAGKDENKRAPMYWSADPGAEGMCSGPSGMDSITMKFECLAEQEKDQGSVYQFYKQVIRARNQNPEIARGEAEYIDLGEEWKDSVCVLKKTYGDSEILLVFATGRDEQEIDLSRIELNGKPVGKASKVRAMLTTGEDKIVLAKNGIAKMPGYSVLILK